MGLTKPRAAQIYDIDYKQATRVITVTNITLAGGAPSQVDSVNLAKDDRVLVIGQSTASQNGIYYVSTLGTGSNGTWTRSSDTDATGELLAGTIVMVTEGTVYHDTQWKLTTNDPIVIGTTPLTFEQNSAFAFGNIYANGTAVLATSVGDVLTLSAGNNIQITGNNTAKSVTIGVTGISLTSIANGTSNVNVTSSGGNVTIGVGGTDGIATFATTGEYVTGVLSASGNITGGNVLTSGIISATGNITGGNILGNGYNLSGINTFKTVAVTGQTSIVSGNIDATLTLAAGNNISITTAANTVTIAYAAAGGGSIFATGGDMGLISQPVTSSEDLGNVTTLADTSYDLGTLFSTVTYNQIDMTGFTSNINTGNLNATGLANIVGNINGGNITTAGLISATGNITVGNIATAGLISATGNITGGNIATAGLISATGNITVGNIATAGLISATGNITSANTSVTGNTTITYAPATTVGAGLTVSAANTQGGTGYADFLKATNTSGGATNPNKTFRLSSTGGIEIINSAYSATCMSLSDTGAMSTLLPYQVAGKQAVNGPAFRAYVSVNQTITSGSQQKATFGAETFDTLSNFATSRFTPTVEGYYQFNATVRIAGGTTTGECMIVLYKNGSEYARGNNEAGTEQGASFYSMQVSDIAYANGTTDYFEVYIQQTSGASKDTQSGSAISYFSGSMIRGAQE